MVVNMELFSVVLMVATLLCALVAGLVLAFAVVVMPGIGSLGDREFLRAFQAMDDMIQDRQPVFMVVWVGSIVAVLGGVWLGVCSLDGWDRILLLCATALYLLTVQLPTMAINIPLNNDVQTLDVDRMSEGKLRSARDTFEGKWNRWNRIRTVTSCVTTGILILILQRYQ